MERALIVNGTLIVCATKQKSEHFIGIRCLRIDQKSKGEGAAKIFKNDPSILVLLLHGFVGVPCYQHKYTTDFICSERENAGLNVTCASRVFLLESVVHHAFEVQGRERDQVVSAFR